jgi:type IV pilus assembly protein PilV
VFHVHERNQDIMNLYPHTYRYRLMKKHDGFTLIEVLIAVVILAGGLLGLAALQAAGLSNSQSSYNRSQATQLAYDIADRMRANPKKAANYLTTFMKPSDANASATACSSSANSCTPEQLAEKDLDDWSDDLATLLPFGEGEIRLVGFVYTVTVKWDDDKDGVANFNFEMRFQL